MSEPIEEITGTKKRRDKGLQIWAQMIQRQQARGAPPVSVSLESSGSGGGSGSPRDSFRPDPRKDTDTAARIAALKAAGASQAPPEAKDSFQTHTPQQSAASEKPAPEPEPAQAKKLPPLSSVPTENATESQEPGKAAAAGPHGERESQNASREASGAASLLTEGSPESANELTQLMSLASVKDPNQEETEERPVSSDREAALMAAEEATFMAALRSGIGADPSKAAKDYVLASQLPGVKDTLQGGIYEEFRVAL